MYLCVCVGVVCLPQSLSGPSYIISKWVCNILATWIIGASASCYFIMAAGLIGEHWRSFEHLDRRNARNSLYFECPNFHRNSGFDSQ